MHGRHRMDNGPFLPHLRPAGKRGHQRVGECCVPVAAFPPGKQRCDGVQGSVRKGGAQGRAWWLFRGAVCVWLLAG